MACYHPLQAWYGKDKTVNGKNSIVFNPKTAIDPDTPIDLPCGQCIGCRLERSRQWAVRCVHEASLYEHNCFVTLTFNDESLVERDRSWSIDVRDLQLFMKRLRKRFKGLDPVFNESKGINEFPIRYFSCGEYGEKYGRPHYHLCLFNFDFLDKELYKENPNGDRLYISKSLQEIWPFGYAIIGDVTFESAAYVARYITKKVTGEQAEEHYKNVDINTGEFKEYTPEFTTMSRRPGIGKRWFDMYRSDVYPKDFITINGKKVNPPKYYDKMLSELDELQFDDIKEQRLINAAARSYELTPERLSVKERLAEMRLSNLPRNIEKE